MVLVKGEQGRDLNISLALPLSPAPGTSRMFLRLISFSWGLLPCVVLSLRWVEHFFYSMGSAAF